MEFYTTSCVLAKIAWAINLPEETWNFFFIAAKKVAYPGQTRELDENEDDQPLVSPDRTAVSEREGDQPLVQSTSI